LLGIPFTAATIIGFIYVNDESELMISKWNLVAACFHVFRRSDGCLAFLYLILINLLISYLFSNVFNRIYNDTLYDSLKSKLTLYYNNKQIIKEKF